MSANKIYRTETRSTRRQPDKTITALAVMPKSDPCPTSWWLGLTREEFSAEAARQQDRMLGQKTSYVRGDVR